MPANQLSRYLADGVPVEEIAASRVSFQNSEAINRNISIFFSVPFFEILDRFEAACHIPSARKSGPARFVLPRCWQTDLARVFSLRHEFAHDANSTTQVSAAEMQSMETTVLLTCQAAVLLPGIEAPILVSSSQLPVILLIEDLVSEDWEIDRDRPTEP